MEFEIFKGLLCRAVRLSKLFVSSSCSAELELELNLVCSSSSRFFFFGSFHGIGSEERDALLFCRKPLQPFHWICYLFFLFFFLRDLSLPNKVFKS